MSTSFLYGTIPFMKATERMTNPCFQDKDFAKVMKCKHVEWDPDEFRVEFESAEVLEHVEDDGYVVSTIREWKRRDWGEGGDDFHWWCTESSDSL